MSIVDVDFRMPRKMCFVGPEYVFAEVGPLVLHVKKPYLPGKAAAAELPMEAHVVRVILRSMKYVPGRSATDHCCNLNLSQGSWWVFRNGAEDRWSVTACSLSQTTESLCTREAFTVSLFTVKDDCRVRVRVGGAKRQNMFILSLVGSRYGMPRETKVKAGRNSRTFSGVK